MAIKYLKAKSNLKDAPLTKDELEIIQKVEDYIDNEINENFDGNELHFDTNVLDFRFNPDNPSQHTWGVFSDIKDIRKGIMSEELKSRYIKHGWEWKLNMDDGLDGPNMSGPDYWILRGRKDLR